MVIAVFLARRLLPERESRALPPDLSGHARTLVEQFRLDEGLHQLRVREGSPLVGKPRVTLDLAAHGVTLVTVRGAGSDGEPRLGEIEADDLLLVRGGGEAIAALTHELDVALRDDADAGPVERILFTRGSGLAEVLVPPRSPLIGDRLFPGMVTDSGDLVVLAVQRGGADLTAGEALLAGDMLLLQGTWEALDRHLAPPEVVVVNSPDLVRRQALPMGPGSLPTLGVLVAMVVLLATGFLPAAVVGLLSAAAILLLGILSVDEIYRAINWTTVILVGAMMPLSTAITETGAAKLLADQLISLVGAGGPRALLAGLFVLTAVLGQVISNTATALIIIPISVVAELEMGISPQPVLMSVAVAAAAAFLTPVATPTNLMVMGPGGYAFGDYWKLGLPLLLWFFVVAVFIVPMVWHF
jgi:di/tricarboxylate transporter